VTLDEHVLFRKEALGFPYREVVQGYLVYKKTLLKKPHQI